MNGHEWEIALLAIGALLTALIGAIFRRAEKTGERMGRVEKWIDQETGRQEERKAILAQILEVLRDERRGSNGQ